MYNNYAVMFDIKYFGVACSIWNYFSTFAENKRQKL